jgi:hypothetical protein
MSTDFIKAERAMFDSYGGLRLPLDAMKTRDDLCSDRTLSDQGAYNHHSIDDILGYRRMQENMKGLFRLLYFYSSVFYPESMIIPPNHPLRQGIDLSLKIGVMLRTCVI